MGVPRNFGEVCRVPARVSASTTQARSALESVRVQCPLSPHDRTAAECSKCERFVGWGISTAGELLLACRVPCACCQSVDHVAVEVFEAVFCEECLERAQVAEEDDELGGGG